MTTINPSVLASLLQHVPQESRSIAVRAAVDSIRQGSVSEIGPLGSLLGQYPDSDAEQNLALHLRELLDDGKTPATTELPDGIRDDLLGYAVICLERTVGDLVRGRGRSVEVSMERMPGLLANREAEVDSGAEEAILDFQHIKFLLAFARSSVRSDSPKNVVDGLLNAAIVLSGCADRDIASAASSVLSWQVKLGLTDDTSRASQLWSWLQALLSSSEAFYRNLAFSLWLRCASSHGKLLLQWMKTTYWSLLQEGMQNGDAERRKQCLAILRQSVVLAAGIDSLCGTIGNDLVTTKDIGPPVKPELKDSAALVEQYERYCTVFETVLLGRYLNQVIATKPDLDFLSKSTSLVRTAWLHVLLAAALHPKIQDSNRKFIGNWIMRSKFQSECSAEFVRFLESAFLPWATQGSLFTSTLSEDEGRLRCTHGERLADYICGLLEANAVNNTLALSIVDAVLDLIVNRRSGNFAYASVYLLEGVAQGLQVSPAVRLEQKQLRRIADLSTWAALPEVARDFVFLRCLKLCAESPTSSTSTNDRATSRAGSRWSELQKLLQDSTSDVLLRGPVAAWDTKSSKRDQLEAAALEKCGYLRALLNGEARISAEVLMTQVEDIWSEMEYLEYPKNLLMQMPSLILHKTTLALAQDHNEVMRMVSARMSDLQTLSASRVYLFPPFACAIRNLTIFNDGATDLLDIEDLIICYADCLPEPTVDLRLEDATTYLLQSIEPNMTARFGYEYYFGKRGMFGVAALIDLVSRMGSTNITQAIFDRLLQRWAKQRAPVPSVSSWKTTLQLQLMLLTCEQILPHLDAEAVLQKLHYVLSIEPLPRYRYLLSWIIARIYLQKKDPQQRILSELGTKDHHSNPKYLASLLKIGVMIAKTEGTDPEFAFKLACAFVPLAASSKVVIRHEAQWQIPRLMDHAETHGWDQITGNAAFVALNDYIRSLERYEIPPLERQLDRFDPVLDHTMTNLVEGPWYGLDSTESPLCGRVDFLALWEGDAQQGIQKLEACIPLGDPIVLPTIAPHESSIAGTSSVENAQALTPSKGDVSRALQTKGTAYLTSGLENEAEQSAKRNELIVVASLVDNPYNLGGLSRVSEIFGASEMHLQNQNVTSNKDFSNVSVSSHVHLPMFQLSATAVVEYLMEKKRDGWSIVGIEQTDRSVLLGTEACKLPRKTVLIIGGEKEGIPALVLGECDLLVEIPQQGITRSLNVQTAAGIVLFEYTRQHRGVESSRVDHYS
ncbi:hypothetical protein LTR78_000619 [Recurvomyces mirabilis]|uniref:tRNA/rRNA methyltransferase SpoU type domain-containing protein n=1 Tax=Recurvomyces mirabilis TaxID=574656 RepID=A0AAE1C6Q2_9PEZI|nr:hypothetical protein LTR78_000619 [Recurvomyces mirabilis]KAK5162273.1 hypothetical protein LTS14_000620 [Recurvomyces mirabilis]